MNQLDQWLTIVTLPQLELDEAVFKIVVHTTRENPKLLIGS